MRTPGRCQSAWGWRGGAHNRCNTGVRPMKSTVFQALASLFMFLALSGFPPQLRPATADAETKNSSMSPRRETVIPKGHRRRSFIDCGSWGEPPEITKALKRGVIARGWAITTAVEKSPRFGSLAEPKTDPLLLGTSNRSAYYQTSQSARDGCKYLIEGQ